MKLEDIRLSEINQTQKDKCCRITTYTKNLKGTNSLIEKEIRIVVTTGDGGGRGNWLKGTNFQLQDQ